MKIMHYKNILFNPKCNSIEDVLKREEVKGLECEKVVYLNEYEAIAVFYTTDNQEEFSILNKINYEKTRANKRRKRTIFKNS